MRNSDPLWPRSGEAAFLPSGLCLPTRADHHSSFVLKESVHEEDYPVFMDQTRAHPHQVHELLATARRYEAAGDLEQAMLTLQSALPVRDSALHAQLLNALALLQKRTGAFAQALTYGEETALLATLWNNLAFIEHEAGNLDQARQYQRQALQIARATGDVLAIVETLLAEALLDKDQQRLLTARTTVDSAFELPGRRRAPRLRGHLSTLHALLALLLNHLAEARTWYTRALAAYRRAGDRANEALVLHNLGQMYDHHIDTPRR